MDGVRDRTADRRKRPRAELTLTARIALASVAAAVVGVGLYLAFGGRDGSKPSGGANEASRLVDVNSRTTFVAVGDLSAVNESSSAALWKDVRSMFRGVDVLVGMRPGRASIMAGAGNVEQDLGRVGLDDAAFVASGRQMPPVQLRADMVSVATGNGVAMRLETERPVMALQGGLRFVTLAFTDPLDLRGRRAGQAWSKPLDLEPALASVRSARRSADVVVITVRWGNEMQAQLTSRQRRIARRLVEAGADLVIGSLPQQVQPIELLQVGTRRAVVAYSLGGATGEGGAISGLRASSRSDRRDGAALEVTFAKVRGDTVILEDVSYEPLWTVSEGRSVAARRQRLVPIDTVAAGLLRRLEETAATRASATGSAAIRVATRRLIDLQDQFRGLTLRRERIESVLGGEERLKDALRGAKKSN